jgi:HPt (histidine-containing phosphotransfer) domain-containing protein
MTDPSIDHSFDTGVRRSRLLREEALASYRALSVSAVRSNLERVSRLLEAVSAAMDGQLDEAGHEQAALIAHKIVGSAATFGFTDATTPARELEEIFACGYLTPAGLEQARKHLAEINAALTAEPDLRGY